MKRTLFIAIIVLSLGILVSACGGAANATPTAEVIPTVIADDTVIAEGRLEPVHYADVAFDNGGTVSEVLVQDGQQVKKGDVLIRIGDATDPNYAAAELELANVEQAFRDLEKTAGSELAQVIIDLREATARQKEAADYLHYLQTDQTIHQTDTKITLVRTPFGLRFRYKDRDFVAPAPADWIIDAQNDLALKTAKMEELQRAYDRMKDGVDTEQLALLEARLHAAKAMLASFAVTAPFDGVVANMDVKVGSTVQAGAMAVTIADLTEWVIKTTDVTEIDVVNLSEGQPVTVTFDAFPGVELTGSVVSIAKVYTQNQGDVVYEVVVKLSETDPGMRWGMTADVAFENEN
jgi:multidrug resistance efflux pump